MKKVLIFFLMIAFSSCDLNYPKLTLVNNTDHPIYYRLLKDTILTSDIYLYTAPANDSVKPHFVMGGEGAWEYKINNDGLDSALYIFFFNYQTISDWAILNRDYRRYRFKVKDLDSMNWVFYYND